MALEVGIVGLQSAGKSLLFEALTGTRATGEVGMAAIPDPRLHQLAAVVQARKITPAAIRVSEVRGTTKMLRARKTMSRMRWTRVDMGRL